MTARIVLADDHAVFRGGLRAYLEREKDLEIVGEAGTAGDLMERLKETPADVLILDIRMPGPPVAEVILEALKAHPKLQIVVLTMLEEECYLRDVFKAGARAFVLKKSAPESLVEAIRAVLDYRSYVDPGLSNLLVSSYLTPSKKNEKSAAGGLTKREIEVVRLLALGHTNEEIGDILNISKRTAETHRENIMIKLGVQTRAALVRYALEHGWMPQP